MDWNPPLLYETIRRAHQHRGTGFVRIIQRCPVYAGQYSKALQADPERFLILEHEQGISLDDSVRRAFKNRQQHDPSDLAKAFALAHDESRIPIGLLYHNPEAPCYEDLSSQGVDMTPQERLDGLNRLLDRMII